MISIERLQPLTQVPGTTNFIKGISPVLRLKEQLHLRTVTTSDSNQILVIHMNDIQIGLIIDEATEVMDIGSTLIESPSEFVRGVEQEYISGIAKIDHKFLILLDLEKVTNQYENHQLQKVANQ